jgi:hypothetical protein
MPLLFVCRDARGEDFGDSFLPDALAGHGAADNAGGVVGHRAQHDADNSNDEQHFDRFCQSEF